MFGRRPLLLNSARQSDCLKQPFSLAALILENNRGFWVWRDARPVAISVPNVLTCGSTRASAGDRGGRSLHRRQCAPAERPARTRVVRFFTIPTLEHHSRQRKQLLYVSGPPWPCSSLRFRRQPSAQRRWLSRRFRPAQTSHTPPRRSQQPVRRQVKPASLARRWTCARSPTAWNFFC